MTIGVSASPRFFVSVLASGIMISLTNEFWMSFSLSKRDIVEFEEPEDGSSKSVQQLLPLQSLYMVSRLASRSQPDATKSISLRVFAKCVLYIVNLP